jgi:hypothetical protein
MSSRGVAAFSVLGEGRASCVRGAWAKKDVMGLYSGFGFAGDLAGDFLPGEAARRGAARVGFASPRAPLATEGSVPLLGRLGGGGGEFEASSSESDEMATGFFRAAARGLPIPSQDVWPGKHSAAM